MLIKNGKYLFVWFFSLTYLFVKAQCTPTLNVIPPTCSSPGGYQLIVPLSCSGPTPYSLFWGFGGGCQSPTLTTIPGPGTYSNFFTAGCGSIYNVSILDNSFNPIGGANGNGAPASPVTATFIPGAATQPSCNGFCNGSRTLFWQGAGPLTVTLFPAAPGASVVFNNVTTFATQTFTGLCAGTHSLHVLDNNGCTYTTGLTFTLGQPSAVSAVSNFSNPNCNGAGNGSFSVTVSGGTPGYTVNFSNSTSVILGGAGTATLGGLSPGVITATVIDTKNCTFTTSATITDPPVISITPTQTNVNCFGTCNGAASVAVTGGGGTYSYTWSPGPSNLAGITGICATTHTVTILDNLNCQRSQTFNVTQPTSITLSPLTTSLSCFGVCDGSGTVTASGPTTAVSFTWVATGGLVISTSSVISSKCAGTYTIIAKDAVSGPTCVVSQTISLAEPPTYTITATTQSISCITNTCSGSATAVVVGSNGPPFTYSWVPSSQTTSVATSLCTGSHTVTVRDGSNCPTSTVITIVEPPTFTPNITTASLSCNPGNAPCNGSISAAPTGGTGPYTFTLLSSGAPVTTAPPYLNLCPGNYTVIIKDSSPATCGQSFTTSLLAPNLLTVSITSSTLACNTSTGTMAANPAGGTPAYSFTWTTPLTSVLSPTLNNTVSNTIYTLTLKDANSCSVTVTQSVSSPPPLTVTLVSTSVTCSGAANGALNASPSGGTPGYLFNWSSGSGNPNTGLIAGTYTLVLSDQNGCQITSTASVASPSAVAITLTAVAVSCAPLTGNSSNGTCSITANGGTPVYSYVINTSPATTNTTNGSGIFSGLSPGNYIATVFDNNGCASGGSVFAITFPSAISAAITGTQNSCSACTGAATVTGSNGTPGYTFSWTNSVSAVVSSAATATALCPGPYTVAVTDTKGCVDQTTVTIVQTVVSAIVSGGTGIQCFGASTASAVVSPAGGTPPYSFTWTPSAQTTQTATNLSAQNYTVTISESGAGCTSTASILITQPSSITLTSNAANLTCFGVCNGSVNATASGGTGPLSFSWSPGGQTTSSLTALCSNTYVIRVTDANGCTVTPQSLVVTQPSSITATFTNTLPTGCTLNNGSVCVTPTGGSGAGYTFTWSPGGLNTSCISGLASGVYSVIIRDGTGVCTNTLSTVLNSPNGPTITSSSQSVACFGFSTGSASITANGTAPFTFTWSPAVAGNTNAVSGIPSGTYVVSVQDGNSCVTNQSLVINQPTAVSITSLVAGTNCNTGNTGSIGITPSGGTPGYSFAWNGPSAFTSNLQNITSLASGVYTVNVSDANTCVTSFTFNVTSPPALTLTTASSQTVICSGLTNGSITASGSGGTNPISYSWTPLGAFSGSSTATVLNLGPGIYTVSITDGKGCTTNSTYTLTASNFTTGVTVQAASCSNSNNAVATVTVSGGAPTYSFSWSLGASTSSVLSNLGPANYTSSAVDVNGCISQIPFTITALPAFSITTIGTPPLCNGQCNGSISATPSGASGAVTYAWLPTGTGQNPTGLCGNQSFTLVATDANSCSATSVVNLSQPPLLVASVVFTNPLCSGNCNGIAVVTPSNAVGTLSITWLPAGPNSTTASSLCSGPYTVTVTDANGCSDFQNFTLSNPTPLNVISSVGPASCGNSNGSITIVPSGGTPAYTYTWSPNVSTTVSATGLAAQVYTVIVKDNANCSNTITIPLSNSNGPVAAVSKTNAVCNGTCNGAILLGALSGGTAPYQVPVWIIPTPSVSGSTLTNLCAGNYTVQLEDNLGCKTFTGATITQPTSVTITPNIGLATCNGICNGSVSVNATGGIPTYSYNWTPAAPNTSVLTGLCAQSYSVNILSNAGQCSSTFTFDIPGQVNITFTDAIVPNACFGTCNGSTTVTVLPTPGIPSPFAFSWSNGQTGVGPMVSSITNLCTNVYSVTATGANGCFNTHTVDITSPPQLTLSTAVTQPSCNQCNGSATVTPGGGSGTTYSINWGNGATTTVIANLCAAPYPVTITDNLGCTQSQTVIVNNSNGITGETKTTLDIPCGMTASGAATVVAIGGNPPISYNWLSPATTGTVISNLPPGTYFVQMQDAQGCIRNASVDINAATSITLSPFITPPACGATNGTIHVVVAGGTPSYNFSWLPSAPASATLNNIGPGSYTLTVSDASPGGCPTTQAFNISNKNAPTIGFTPTHINCFNTCTGALATTITGTATPFIYNWSSGGNTPSLSNLCKGVITLTVTDSNTCIAVNSATINENPQLQASIPQITQPTCNQCNGLATLNALGGVGPYTYSWTNGAVGTSASSLCAGLYQVLITDQLNCQQTQNVNINNSNGITGETFSIQAITCSGNCNGGVTVTPIGGTTPISFSWINPALTSSINAANNLCSGIYFVQMTDANGCKRTSSLSITPVNDFSITSNIVQPSCGSSNGIISVLVTGGTAPYSYSWTPAGPNSASLTNISPGIYVIAISDQSGSGCAKTQSFTISNLTGPTVTFTQSNIACFGSCNGSIAVSTASAGATFSWSNGNTTSSLTNLCEGIVTLTVTAANGCKTVKAFTITENPELEFNYDLHALSCLGKCDAVVNLLPIGGKLTYSFSSNATLTANSASSLCAGTYSFIISDAAGCVLDTVVQLKNPIALSPTLNSINSSCSSMADGSATVNISGGKPKYTLVWSGPSGFTSNTPTLTNIFSGSYSLSITDSLGCKKDSVLTIVTTVTIVADAGRDTIICPRNSVILNAQNSKGVSKFEWYALPNVTTLAASTSSFTLSDAIESYTYQLVATSSVAGCFDKDTVVVATYPEPYIDAGPSYTIPVFSAVTIGGNPTLNGPESVIWSPSMYLDDASLQNPITSNTISVTFTATIMYGNGCAVSDTMRVQLYPEIVVNNGFSPNNDGKNDLWIIDYLEQFPDNTVEIFNRWGELLFYSKGYENPFDGTYKGKNLPVGTYYYVIHLNHPAYPKPYTGPLTIFR